MKEPTQRLKRPVSTAESLQGSKRQRVSPTPDMGAQGAGGVARGDAPDWFPLCGDVARGVASGWHECDADGVPDEDRYGRQSGRTLEDPYNREQYDGAPE